MNFSTLKIAVAVAVSVIGLGATFQAQATQLIVNGGFETGTVAGWNATTTESSPFQAALNDGKNSQIVTGGPSNQAAWFVRNKAANYFRNQAATPITGYSAYNGFDGSGGNFKMSQGFTVDGSTKSALLDFMFATQATYSGNMRTFDANIMNSTGTSVLFNAYHFDLPKQDSTWAIHSISLDISSALNALGAGNYMLTFQEFVPSFYTGPAQFALDNISLDVKSVPEPASLGLLGLGLLGMAAARRRNRK